MEIGLQPLVEPAQRQPGIGVLHVQSDPHDPHGIDGLIQGFKGMNRHLLAYLFQPYKLFFSRRVLLFPREPLRLSCKILCIGFYPFEGDDHRIERILFIQVRSALATLYNPRGDTFYPFFEHAWKIRYGMRDSNRLPHKVCNKPFVNLLSERIVVFLSGSLPEVSLCPERKHLVMENASVFPGYAVRVENSLFHRIELAPDHGALGIRIDDYPDFFCRCCARDEIVSANHGLSVFHEITNMQGPGEMISQIYCK